MLPDTFKTASICSSEACHFFRIFTAVRSAVAFRFSCCISILWLVRERSGWGCCYTPTLVWFSILLKPVKFPAFLGILCFTPTSPWFPTVGEIVFELQARKHTANYVASHRFNGIG